MRISPLREFICQDWREFLDSFVVSTATQRPRNLRLNCASKVAAEDFKIDLDTNMRCQQRGLVSITRRSTVPLTKAWVKRRTSNEPILITVLVFPGRVKRRTYPAEPNWKLEETSLAGTAGSMKICI